MWSCSGWRVPGPGRARRAAAPRATTGARIARRRSAGGAGGQRQNSSKAWPRRDGQNRSRSVTRKVDIDAGRRAGRGAAGLRAQRRRRHPTIVRPPARQDNTASELRECAGNVRTSDLGARCAGDQLSAHSTGPWPGFRRRGPPGWPMVHGRARSGPDSDSAAGEQHHAGRPRLSPRRGAGPGSRLRRRTGRPPAPRRPGARRAAARRARPGRRRGAVALDRCPASRPGARTHCATATRCAPAGRGARRRRAATVGSVAVANAAVPPAQPNRRVQPLDHPRDRGVGGRVRRADRGEHDAEPGVVERAGERRRGGPARRSPAVRRAASQLVPPPSTSAIAMSSCGCRRAARLTSPGTSTLAWKARPSSSGTTTARRCPSARDGGEHVGQPGRGQVEEAQPHVEVGRCRRTSSTSAATVAADRGSRLPCATATRRAPAAGASIGAGSWLGRRSYRLRVHEAGRTACLGQRQRGADQAGRERVAGRRVDEQEAAGGADVGVVVDGQRVGRAQR